MQRAVIAIVLSLIALDARAETKPSKPAKKVSSWRVQFPKLSINADFEAIGTGFVAAGMIESDTTDILVVRLDAKGKQMWRYREGTKDVHDNARGIAVAADGSVLVVGQRGEDAVATRLGANGKRTWSVKLAGKNAHDAVAVKGGWVIAGTDGGARLWFVDAKGKVGWTLSAGGTDGGSAYSVRVRDGGVVAVGDVSSANGDAFFWSVDLDGKQRAFERMTDPALNVSATDFAPTATGYIVPLNLWKRGTGTTGETVKLVELDHEGKLVREVPIVGKELRFRRIVTNPAGGFTLVGHRNGAQAWIVNLDDNLAVIRNATFNYNDYTAATAVVAAGGRIVIAGLRMDGGTFIEAGPAETVGRP